MTTYQSFQITLKPSEIEVLRSQSFLQEVVDMESSSAKALLLAFIGAVVTDQLPKST